MSIQGVCDFYGVCVCDLGDVCFALLCFALISNEKRGEMKLREHCLMLRLLDTMLFL